MAYHDTQAVTSRVQSHTQEVSNALFSTADAACTAPVNSSKTCAAVVLERVSSRGLNLSDPNLCGGHMLMVCQTFMKHVKVRSTQPIRPMKSQINHNWVSQSPNLSTT
jgi:hypothetical protein